MIETLLHPNLHSLLPLRRGLEHIRLYLAFGQEIVLGPDIHQYIRIAFVVGKEMRSVVFEPFFRWGVVFGWGRG